MDIKIIVSVKAPWDIDMAVRILIVAVALDVQVLAAPGTGLL